MKINGNSYKLIEETSKAQLYAGITPGGGEFYEVWLIRRWKNDKVGPFGQKVLAGDFRRPTNEDFGTYAWSYITKDRALYKLAEITGTYGHILNDHPQEGI